MLNKYNQLIIEIRHCTQCGKLFKCSLHCEMNKTEECCSCHKCCPNDSWLNGVCKIVFVSPVKTRGSHIYIGGAKAQ